MQTFMLVSRKSKPAMNKYFSMESAEAFQIKTHDKNKPWWNQGNKDKLANLKKQKQNLNKLKMETNTRWEKWRKIRWQV